MLRCVEYVCRGQSLAENKIWTNMPWPCPPGLVKIGIRVQEITGATTARFVATTGAVGLIAYRSPQTLVALGAGANDDHLLWSELVNLTGKSLTPGSQGRVWAYQQDAAITPDLLGTVPSSEVNFFQLKLTRDATAVTGVFNIFARMYTEVSGPPHLIEWSDQVTIT